MYHKQIPDFAPTILYSMSKHKNTPRMDTTFPNTSLDTHLEHLKSGQNQASFSV